MEKNLLLEGDELNNKIRRIMKLNKYVDINTLSKESKRDYIDRHSAFIKCENEAKKGEMFSVLVRVGDEYPHPDDFDHYISYVQLYDGETLLAQTNFEPGVVFGNGEKGNVHAVFNLFPRKSMRLTAIAYCTKHGLWESETVKVKVL